MQSTPSEYRIGNQTLKPKTKNDHFRDLLRVAKSWGFQPTHVWFNRWYASLENFKLIRSLEWKFLTRLEANRLVRIDRGEANAVSEQPIAENGTVVWLPHYGELKMFRIVATSSYWVSNDLDVRLERRGELEDWSWTIQEYHRELKQYTGVEHCSVRLIRGQLRQIGLSLRAYVRLEYNRVKLVISWFTAKMEMYCEAIRLYLRNPLYQLPKTSTA